MSKTICLVMIVKNEEKQLPRCFSTIKDHIDTYCIVDTGSTDNTIQVIKDELKDIPGHIIKRPWVNFGHNRSESLGFASTKADYLLLCDADEQIVFLPSFNKDNLTAEQYMIKYDGNLDYSVPYLIKSGLNWSYVGVTHEYLACDKEPTQEVLNTIKIIDHADGGSKHDKFERDIKLLTQDLEKDPNNPRSMFYLANSYRDTHQNLQAIEWYQKRIDAGGWIEEVTCAYLYKGLCQERLGKKQDAIFTFLEGYEYNRSRAECIYEAIRLLRIDGKYKTAYVLAKDAKTIPYPKNDILFIDRSVYEWKIDYELSIVTYYANKKEDIRDTFKNLFARRDVNHQNIIANYKWYCKDIKRFEIDSIDLTQMFEMPEGYKGSSPCIFKYEDGYGVNVRLVSYHLVPGTADYSEVMASKTNGKINTRNIFLKLDSNFNKIDEHLFEIDDFNKVRINGIEDLKVIDHNGELRFTGTKWYDYDNIGIVHGKYDLSKPVLEYERLESPENRPVEKNWVPFNFGSSLEYIYDWSPIRFGNVEYDTIKIGQYGNTHLPHFRGSSPGFEYKDEIYFLVHAVEYVYPRNYYHSIVKFSKRTGVYLGHSKLFTFEGNQIEYGLGLIVNDDNVIISHSIWDGSSQIKVYDKEKLFNDIF